METGLSCVDGETLLMNHTRNLSNILAGYFFRIMVHLRSSVEFVARLENYFVALSIFRDVLVRGYSSAQRLSQCFLCSVKSVFVVQSGRTVDLYIMLVTKLSQTALEGTKM